MAVVILLALGASPDLVRIAAQNRAVPSGTSSIGGRVTNATSRQPIAGVVLTLHHDDSGGTLVTLSEQDGRYRFELIARGDYRVSAALDGYVAREYGRGETLVNGEHHTISGRTVIGVGADQARADIDLVLEPAGHVLGKVTVEGAPVNGATVVALRKTDTDGHFFIIPSTQGRTDANGLYAIRNLQPGTYYVTVRRGTTDDSAARVLAGRKSTYFPGTELVAEALPVGVKAGVTTTAIDIALPARVVRTLSGAIVRGASTGRPDVTLVSSAGRTQATLSAKERFEFADVEPGRYTLVARVLDTSHPEAGYLALDLTDDQRDVVLSLAPVSDITGLVVTEDDEPYAFGTAEIVADLVDDAGQRIESVPGERARLDAEGRFHLRGLFGTRTLRLIGTQREIDRVLVGDVAVERIALVGNEPVVEVKVISVRR